MDHQRTALQQRLHVAWCVAGILGSLLLYGVMQASSPAVEQTSNDDTCMLSTVIVCLLAVGEVDK